MLSVIVPAHNARQYTANCLASLLQTFRALGADRAVEFILVDDCSDPDQHVADLYADFRRQTTSTVKIVRFRERRYYGWGCAYGFAAARGSAVLFVSNDMILTPDYVRGVLALAALDETFGIVRGTAEYVDCFPQHQLAPPLRTRGVEDLFTFSAYVARHFGLAHEEDHLLTGDAMLIKRQVFEKIGSFDTRFPFGYFSDLDFGLRAQRAGFKMVCAKGAWLHHEGAGAYKDEAATRKIDIQKVHAERMKKVQACYESFRLKWDPSMPPNYTHIAAIDFAALRGRPEAAGFQHQPFVALQDPLVELL